MRQLRRKRRIRAATSDVLHRTDDLLAKGSDAEAGRLLDEALSRDPDDAELWLRAATAAVLADPQKATVLARRAASLAPRDPGALLRTAWFVFSAGELEEAAALADRAGALAPPDFIHANDLLHLRGRIAAVREQHEVAEQLLRQAFEAEPAGDHHAAAYAEILLIRENYPEALRIIAVGLQHFPDDEWLHRVRHEVIARSRSGDDDTA
jgi:Tfp pilus assembly protein PilF